jgi:hypothetical protein
MLYLVTAFGRHVLLQRRIDDVATRVSGQKKSTYDIRQKQVTKF